MACMEWQCTNNKCGFYEFNNEEMKMCPRCGDRLIGFFDEENDHYDNYSPRGDDETDFAEED